MREINHRLTTGRTTPMSVRPVRTHPDVGSCSWQRTVTLRLPLRDHRSSAVTPRGTGARASRQRAVTPGDLCATIAAAPQLPEDGRRATIAAKRPWRRQHHHWGSITTSHHSAGARSHDRRGSTALLKPQYVVCGFRATPKICLTCRCWRKPVLGTVPEQGGGPCCGVLAGVVAAHRTER